MINPRGHGRPRDRRPEGRPRPEDPIRIWPHRRVLRTLQAATLGMLLAVSAATGQPQSTVKQVLLLQSLDRGNLTLDRFTSVFRVGLDQRAGRPVNVVQVVVGRTGFVGAPEPAIVDYIRSMYADRAPPDLVMTVGGPAALFARRSRQQLFPGTPLLFGATDQRYLRGAALGENETAVAVVNDHAALIDDILRVLPETRQVFMVTGSGAIGRFMRPELDSGFARFRGRVSFIWSDQLSLPEIVQRVASLPPHSAIVFQTFGSDAQGGSYPAEQVVASLHARANAPMFSAQSPYLGRGVVGGSMMDIDDLARRTADVSTRILNGESPARLRLPPQLRGRRIYDWRELERWNIPENRLPPGSVVQYRRPSLWDEHRVTVVIVAVALVLESLLIGRLLHELGQPVTSIVYNAQALQRMVATNQVPPGATEEIIDDIRAEAVRAAQIIDRHRAMLRNHELQKQPIDLNSVIHESHSLVGHDLRTRRIAATLDLSPAPCVIDGDQVLLQQVVVNLLRNAMDALDESPTTRRSITIQSVVRADDVEVSVRDTGAGLPPDSIGKLFTPFATTKSHGLGIGLTIAQRIVAAHAGTIEARNNVDGGATFIITLARIATPASSRSGRTRRIHPEETASGADDG